MNLNDSASNEDMSDDDIDDTNYVSSEIDGQMVPDAPTQLETGTDTNGESDEEEIIVPEEAFGLR